MTTADLYWFSYHKKIDVCQNFRFTNNKLYDAEAKTPNENHSSEGISADAMTSFDLSALSSNPATLNENFFKPYGRYGMDHMVC